MTRFYEWNIFREFHNEHPENRLKYYFNAKGCCQG